MFQLQPINRRRMSYRRLQLHFPTASSSPTAISDPFEANAGRSREHERARPAALFEQSPAGLSERWQRYRSLQLVTSVTVPLRALEPRRNGAVEPGQSRCQAKLSPAGLRAEQESTPHLRCTNVEHVPFFWHSCIPSPNRTSMSIGKVKCFRLAAFGWKGHD